MKDKISVTLNENILKQVDSLVDNIYLRNRSQAVEYLIEKALKEKKVAVILAGESLKFEEGKIRNRYLLKIGGQAIIDRIIKKLSDSGFKTIYLVADHQTLTNIFKLIGDGAARGITLEYIEEESPKGTASALKLLKNKINKTFLVVYSDLVIDNINLLDIWSNHLKSNMLATMVLSSAPIESNTNLPGFVELEGNKILSFVEKPQRKSISSSIFAIGIYVAEPEVLNYPGENFERQILPELAKRKLLGGQLSSTDYLHIHTHEDLNRVKRKMGLK